METRGKFLKPPFGTYTDMLTYTRIEKRSARVPAHKVVPLDVRVSAHFRKFRVVLLDESLIHFAQPACNTHSSWLVVGLILGSEAFIKRSEVESSTRFPSKDYSVSLKEKRKRVGTCLRAGGIQKREIFG